MRKLSKEKLHKVLLYILLIIISIFFLFPIYWMYITAFKPIGAQTCMPPAWSFNPTLSEFKELFIRTDFGPGMVNTVIVSIMSVAVIIIIASIAGYSFAMYSWRGSDTLMLLFLAVWMFPTAIFAIPVFLMWKKLHLLDTHLGLVFVYVWGETPLAIWLMRSFFLSVPAEISEAAMLDGHSPWGVFFKVVLPLVKTGIITTALLCTILIWNEFLFAHVLTRSVARTAPVVMETFKGLFGARVGWIMAAGVILNTPVFIFTLIIQRHIIRGLTFGAVRGG